MIRALTAAAVASAALVELQLDYVNGLAALSGGPGILTPLEQAVIRQALIDRQYLAYKTRDDLGGFQSAVVGRFVLTGGGRNLVGRTHHQSELPPLSRTVGGGVTSFAPLGGGLIGPPESGTQPVPGLGVPPPVTPPGNSNTVPPSNGGFGGRKPPPTTTTTTPKPKPPPTTTTTPTTPTTPTTTTPTTPTTTTAPTTPTPPTSGPGGASCGTAGLTIISDHATCQLYAVNMAPGGSISEVMTIRNDSGSAFTLSLRAAGSPNPLWNDLQLGVWEVGTPAPVPFPALLWWTTQDNTLTTLPADASVRYELELFLPPTASNADQGLVASIDLIWRAQG